MNIPNNASPLPGQYRYDHAEPDCSGELSDEAIDAQADSLLRDEGEVAELVTGFYRVGLDGRICAHLGGLQPSAELCRRSREVHAQRTPGTEHFAAVGRAFIECLRAAAYTEAERRSEDGE